MQWPTGGLSCSRPEGASDDPRDCINGSHAVPSGRFVLSARPAAAVDSGTGLDAIKRQVHRRFLMANPVALPAVHRELFADARGRGLRASWHPEVGVVVLSIWEREVCIGTFHLAITDAGRLSAMLTTHLGEYVEECAAWADAARFGDATGSQRRAAGTGKGA